MNQVSEGAHQGQYYCPTCEKSFPAGELCPADGTRLMRIKAVIDPLIGRDLDRRYSIIEKLGQGGMGAVYRGSQHSVGREVAIKLVSAHLVNEPDVIKRFLREAKLASRLTHPNAVAVLDFGQTDDGLFYLVMELVTGRTLDVVLKSERVLRPERLVRIGMQICDALEGAHALKIVHRDLKPANIMLLAQGRDLVKVLDFGLAKSVAPDQASTTMTNAGSLLGTPAFMPPELALGQPCDGRADLYSLGCILYLAGSGRMPFVSESVHELIAMHGTQPAPPMTGVPAAVAAVIDRLLQKDPAHRFQTAAATREALEAALEYRAITPPPIADDTQPSIGPFPTTPADFANLGTPVPRMPRSAADIDRFVSSDTMVASAATALQIDPAPRTPRRPRWLVPGIAAGIAAGIVAFSIATRDSSAPGPASQPATAPPDRPAAPAAPRGPQPAPAPVGANGPAIAIDPPAPAPQVTIGHDRGADRDADKDKRRAKKPAKHATKPKPKPAPAPPAIPARPPPANPNPQGTGSKPKPTLPF